MKLLVKTDILSGLIGEKQPVKHEEFFHFSQCLLQYVIRAHGGASIRVVYYKPLNHKILVTQGTFTGDIL